MPILIVRKSTSTASARGVSTPCSIAFLSSNPSMCLNLVAISECSSARDEHKPQNSVDFLSSPSSSLSWKGQCVTVGKFTPSSGIWLAIHRAIKGSFRFIGARYQRQVWPWASNVQHLLSHCLSFRDITWYLIIVERGSINFLRPMRDYKSVRRCNVMLRRNPCYFNTQRDGKGMLYRSKLNKTFIIARFFK